MQLGNGKWESTQFNSRLQPTQIALGTVQGGVDKLNLAYECGTWENGVLNAQKNNGNVAKQTINVLTQGTVNGFNAVQKYEYDSLNRLKSAVENIDGNQTPSWKQTFTFDRYGNRNFDTANTTTIPTGCAVAVCNPQVDPNTNKLVGYQFDNAGNTKVDAANRQFVYDGENKQVEVKDQYGASIGKYFFDGEGKRVKKISATETTVFVYNASGQLVAEYSTQISQTPQVSYLTSDHLGSPRINTDENGRVIARHDFQPFGEEIQRPSYGADDVRQKFTSYERDTETDLDFAQARFYNKTHGRFTSVDPYNIIFEAEDAENEKKGEGQKLFVSYISKPQNWNRYVYVWNNPLRNIDPTGEDVYVVLYTTGNANDEDFRRAAETQAANIRADGNFDPKKDTVLVVGVKTKEDAQAAFDKAAGMEKDYGKIQQVQIFSHADKDGPVFHSSSSGSGGQWSRQEVSNLRINWASGASAYFFGCNTASFAQTFANAQNVVSYGYNMYAYFSNSRTEMIPDQGQGKPLYLIAADYGRANGYASAAAYQAGLGGVYPMKRFTPDSWKPKPRKRPTP